MRIRPAKKGIEKKERKANSQTVREESKKIWEKEMKRKSGR